MKRAFKIILVTLLFLAATALIVAFIQTQNIPVLSPKGKIGEKERDLIVTCSLLMLIVVIPVYILTLVFGWKYREGSRGKYDPDYEHNNIAECCWWGIPLILIVVISVLIWKTTHELNPFRPIKTETKPLAIQVVALNWKWLFIYPEQGIASVNFVQFPEDVPINFEITSDAPMNSFWIPQLGGMIMAMPGMRSKLHLIADHQGTYRGCSAQISGKGFAGMVFTAKSSSKSEFFSWVKRVKSSSPGLTLDEYQQLAMPSQYHPVSSYMLMEEDLFNRVLMKYLTPSP